jgi:hypothetical protein
MIFANNQPSLPVLLNQNDCTKDSKAMALGYSTFPVEINDAINMKCGLLQGEALPNPMASPAILYQDKSRHHFCMLSTQSHQSKTGGPTAGSQLQYAQSGRSKYMLS